MLYVEATLEGYDKVMAAGECLIEASVSLGQNDLSSSCTVVVADPDGAIAQTLINHSLLNGGLQKLQAPSNVAFSNSTTPPAISDNVGQVAGGTGDGGVVVGADPQFTPEIKAFMDLIAYKEVHSDVILSRKGYLSKNDVQGSSGFYTEEDLKHGFPAAGTSYNIGRYQFSYDEWQEVTANPSNNVKNYTPLDQDYMCLWRMKLKGCVAALQAGDIHTAIVRGGVEWASLPGSPYGQVQAGYNEAQAIAYYNQRLAYYKGNTAPQPKVTPTPAAITPEPAPAPVTTSPDNAPPVKGNKLTVTIGEDVFTYYHQSTEYDADNGKTTLGGQSIRYALDKRKRNRVMNDTSLKDFAQTVTTAHGIKLNWQVTTDIKFTSIDQRGLSDYATLLQQAKQSGLFVSENNTSKKGDPVQVSEVTIKPLTAVQDSGLVFKWRRDIISAKFKDEALDASKQDMSSGLLQGESKAALDPMSGQIQQTTPDVDTVPDNSTTGDKAPPAVAQPAPGQELLQAQQRSRVKRVQGLPTTIVVPLSPSTLELKPLGAIKTEGFVDVLNRIWVIDNVKHEVPKGTTTLNLYSPIEVLDLTPANTPPTQIAPTVSTAPLGQNVGGYVYPATNLSPFTEYGRWHYPRPGHLHAGVDFAGGDGGGDIVSIADGIFHIESPNTDGSGYGNYCQVDHQNGVCSRYAHCQSLVASDGQLVKQGQVIAKVGNTGHSFGAHLHFEVFKKGHQFGADTIDPKTLPGLSRLGVVGQQVKAGAKD